MPSGKSIEVDPHLNTKSVCVCVCYCEVSLSLRSEALHRVDMYKLDQRAFTELLQSMGTH